MEQISLDKKSRRKGWRRKWKQYTNRQFRRIGTRLLDDAPIKVRFQGYQ